MDWTVRVPETGEVGALLDVNTVAFGKAVQHDRSERALQLTERERLLGAWEDGRWVGCAGSFPFEMSVPGGSLPSAGVTWVGVLPTHRRRGVLSALMARQLAGCRERGEPLAMLWASEAPIYGRFGYGIGVQVLEQVRIERVHGRLRRHPGARGRVRLVTREEALAAWPAAWEAVRAERAGLHRRSPAWWQLRAIPEAGERGGDGAEFLASLEEAGATFGYVRYRVRGDWRDGIRDGTLEVLELLGIDGGAEAALWEFVLGVDLVERVTARYRPLDEPLWHLLEDPRRLERRPVDALFVRVVDPAAAPEGRRYAADGRVVLEVRDDFGGHARGRFVLECSGGAARCRETTETAAAELDVAALGALYMGQASALTLWRAGLIATDRETVVKMDRLFRWSPEPWAPEEW